MTQKILKQVVNDHQWVKREFYLYDSNIFLGHLFTVANLVKFN